MQDKENGAAKLIQRYFTSYQFKKSLLHFQKLQFDTCGKEYSFLEFQNKLQEMSEKDHDSFKITQTFLDNLKHNISVQKFISIFLVTHYSNEIFSSTQERTKLEKALLSHSTLITTYLHHPTLCQTRKDTKRLLASFSILLSYWLKYDKRKQIEELCDLYFNLPKSFSLDSSATQEEQESFKTQNNNFRKLIRDHIVQISGKRGLQLLIDYGEKMKNIEEKMAIEVQKTMHKTYWKMFQTALEQQPPNYSQVIDRLHEMRNLFIEIVGNSSSWKQKIDEHLDIQFISQRIHHNTFDPPYLRSLIMFIFESIQELGAPINDKEVIQCKTNMLIKMTTSQSYAEFLPILFRNILERLTHLQKSVQIIREKNNAK